MLNPESGRPSSRCGLAVLLALACIPAASAAPEFVTFAVEAPAEPVELVRVDRFSHPRADAVLQALGPLPRPADFAGHYVLQPIPCGTACEELAIIDARDGRVFMPLHRSFSHGAAFRADSRLIVLNPPEHIREAEGTAPEWLCTEYLEWRDGAVEIVHRQCGAAPELPAVAPEGLAVIRPGQLYYRVAYHQPMQRTLQVLRGDLALAAEVVFGDCAFTDHATGVAQLPLHGREEAMLLMSCARQDGRYALYIFLLGEDGLRESLRLEALDTLHLTQTEEVLRIEWSRDGEDGRESGAQDWPLGAADPRLPPLQDALLGRRLWLDEIAAGPHADRLVAPASPDLPLLIGPHPAAPFFRRVGDDLLLHLEDEGDTPSWRVGEYRRVCYPWGGCGYLHAADLRPFAGRPLEANALQGLDLEDLAVPALEHPLLVVSGPEPDALARALMTANYGEYRPDDDCWLARHQAGEAGLRYFCMGLLRLDELDVEGRVLVVAAGREIRPSGEPYDCEACPAWLGIFIAEPAGRGWRVLAQRPLAPHGDEGRPPAPEDVQALQVAAGRWGLAVRETLELRETRVRAFRLFGMRDGRIADMGLVAAAPPELDGEEPPFAWELDTLETLEHPAPGFFPLALRGWREYQGEVVDVEVVLEYDRLRQGFFFEGFED